MEVMAFVLADHAESVNGKLYTVGACWNVIFAPVIPTRHAHISVGVALVVPWNETNDRHTIQLQLQDADGADLLPQSVEGEFEVGRPPGMRPGDEATVVLVFNLNNQEFARAGWHVFVLSVDGSVIGRRRFKLQQVQVPTVSAA